MPDGQLEDDRRTQSEVDLARLKRRLAEVVAIDFFGAPGREAAEGLVSGVEARMKEKRSGKRGGQGSDDSPRGFTGQDLGHP